jgi:hypothetical protein
VGRYLILREQDGLRLGTLEIHRQVGWSLFEFLKADPAIGELANGCQSPIPNPQSPAPNGDLAGRWLAWLRATPWGRRRRGAYPRHFTAGSVSAFLAWPPARFSSGKLRTEQTIGRLWRHGRPLLEWLGLPVYLSKKKADPGRRPSLRLPPPWVPTKGSIGERWQAIWTSEQCPASRGDRRRVLLVQGLVLGTGMRLEEALVAQRDALEGHWLLIRDSKTHQPRIIYVNAQCLGIVEALRPDGQTVMPWAADRWQRISGWPYTKGRWHCLVRQCGLLGKTHQQLRQRMTTWLRAAAIRHGVDPAVESAQLGHGSGVVLEHYLDCLRPLARLLERFRLPAVDGFVWPPPIAARRALPARLYEEFRRIIGGA